MPSGIVVVVTTDEVVVVSSVSRIVVLHDAKTKRELVDLYADDTPGLQGDCRLSHTFKDAGEVLVEVRDTTRGGSTGLDRRRAAHRA